ncbi:uncharacterized protein ACMZJ9_002385 [Mantella aurantiaca]
MSETECERECILDYLITGGAISVLWLVTLLILWILRRKKKVSDLKSFSNICEMTPVTVADKEDTLVYNQIVFPNGNRKPREKNPEEEVTYAQVKTTSQQDDGIIYSDVKCNMRIKKTNDGPVSSDAQTTYAEIKPMSRQPQETSTEVYATVNKKNIANNKAV